MNDIPRPDTIAATRTATKRTNESIQDAANPKEDTSEMDARLRLIHRYMDTLSDTRFQVGALKHEHLIVQRFLLRTIRMPDDLALRLRAACGPLLAFPYEANRDDPLCGFVRGGVAHTLSLPLETIESIARGAKPPLTPSSIRDRCAAMVDDIQTALRNLVDDWVRGASGLDAVLRQYDVLFGQLNQSVALWKTPCSVDARQIIRGLMYLATHVVFVQNEYGSRSPVHTIGYAHICDFLQRGLPMARKTVQHVSDSELLAECVAVWAEHPQYTSLANQVWTEDLLDKKKRAPALKTARARTLWKRTLCFEYMHLTMTLIQAYLASTRAAAASDAESVELDIASRRVAFDA
jgi:hypothetical protein